MRVAHIEAQLRAELDRRGDSFGLTPPVATTYVPHDGGFENAGFTVTDGRVTLHAKCVREPLRLRRWREFGDVLAERYLAPRVVGFLDTPDWSAVVTEHVPGAPPSDEAMPAVCRAVVPFIDRLHHDDDLAARLPEGPPLRSSFLHYFAEILEADLAEMTTLPPFVDEGTAAWMPAEVAAMRARIEADAAFDGPARHPIHGDLWSGNIISGSAGLAIVDWDSLGFGDPALDLVLLMFPAVDHGGLDPHDLLGERDPSFWDRFALGMRGALLLGLVDVLADWSEAARAPDDVRDAHRERAEAVHRWALDRYRTLYG